MARPSIADELKRRMAEALHADLYVDFLRHTGPHGTPERPAFSFFPLDVDQEDAEASVTFTRAWERAQPLVPDASREEAFVLAAQLEQAVATIRQLRQVQEQHLETIRLLAQQLEAVVHQRARSVEAPPSLDTQTLKDLIALCHPDRWPDNPLAHEVTVRLTSLYAKRAKPPQR